MGEGAEGRISPDHKVSVLDISLGGALIEHANLLLPGTLAFLTLLVQGQEISVPCRVVRSTVHRFEVWPNGDQKRTYRTALKCLAVSDDSRRLLSEYIEVFTVQEPTGVRV